MKDDLIKRRDATKAISISCGTCLARGTEDCDKCSVPKLCKLINAIPSADTEIEIIKAEAFAKGIDSERKRISDWCRPQGEWKAKSFHECFCEQCGFSFDIMKCDFLENMKFCPNCGARMKGAEDE